MTENTILVLGGTGKTGRRVAQRLVARDLPVRLGSRSERPPFDWAEPATWAPALAGVTAAYVAYYPDVAAPGAAETVGSFAETAVRAGTRRLVLLSGRGEEEALPTEQAVRDSGADWTIVRSTWFAQNFSEGFFLEPVRSGLVVMPAADVPEPFVDVEDVADVAVAALTEEGHAGQIYELTGPRLLTFADAVGEIAAATGRRIRYQAVSAEQFAAGLAETEVPAEYVQFLTEMFTKVLDGRNAHLTDGVRRALGREPRDFSGYARATAATGVWSA